MSKSLPPIEAVPGESWIDYRVRQIESALKAEATVLKTMFDTIVAAAESGNVATISDVCHHLVIKLNHTKGLCREHKTIKWAESMMSRPPAKKGQARHPDERAILMVRKVPWDAMWHVVYTNTDGRETYDRIPHEVAMEIEKGFELQN